MLGVTVAKRGLRTKERRLHSGVTTGSAGGSRQSPLTRTIPALLCGLSLAIAMGAWSTSAYCQNQSQVEQANQFGQGWKPDPEAVARIVAQQPAFIAKQVESLAAAADDDDALVYRFTAKCLGVSKLEPLDQGGLGSCVGFATAHALETTGAADVVHRREREEWRFRGSGGGMYALSRTHAKQLGDWEGSSGAWAVGALQEWGCLFAGSYDSIDLSRYDIPLIRQWQNRGVPSNIIEVAKKYPARGCALVKTNAELKGLLQNGYAALSCASQTFASRRDQLGFSRGTIPGWNHAMAVVAYRGKASGAEGFLILNSWRPDWISGPEWPDDMPLGSFWCSPADMQKRLDQGDTWGVGGVDLFKKRELNWLETLDIGGEFAAKHQDN